MSFVFVAICPVHKKASCVYGVESICRFILIVEHAGMHSFLHASLSRPSLSTAPSVPPSRHSTLLFFGVIAEFLLNIFMILSLSPLSFSLSLALSLCLSLSLSYAHTHTHTHTTHTQSRGHTFRQPFGYASFIPLPVMLIPCKHLIALLKFAPTVLAYSRHERPALQTQEGKNKKNLVGNQQLVHKFCL